MNFCNVPENVQTEAAGGLAQWPVGHHLTWTVVATVPGWSEDELVKLAAEAWRKWDVVSGITTEYVSTAARANILIGSRRIDGPLGVLAEAQLPWVGIRPDTQLRVWLDNSEKWVEAKNNPQGSVPPGVVMLHEFGHSLGIGHETNGRTDAIMDPAISHLRELQPWDLQQVQLRYGIEVPPDDPDDPLPTPDNDLLWQIIACLKALSPEEKKIAADFLRSLRQ